MVSVEHTLGTTIAIDKMMADWFVRKRGLAFGIRFGIMSGVSVIALSIVSWLLTRYDWRTVNLIWAIVIFICVPLAFFFVREQRPEHYGLLPDGAKLAENSTVDNIVSQGEAYANSVQEGEFTFRQVIRTLAF